MYEHKNMNLTNTFTKMQYEKQLIGYSKKAQQNNRENSKTETANSALYTVHVVGHTQQYHKKY